MSKSSRKWISPAWSLFVALAACVPVGRTSMASRLDVAAGLGLVEFASSPNDMLALSVGSGGNVCEEGDRRRAAVIRDRPYGTGEAIRWVGGVA